MSTEKLVHWRMLANNSDYIGAYCFQPNEEKIVTITNVKREVVTGADGKREECVIVYFKEEKPLILNSTNGKMIQRVLGSPFIQDWVGKRIVLGVEKVRAFGEVVDAVRVKNKKVAQTETVQKCSDCGKPIVAWGNMNPSQVAASMVKRFKVPLCMACGQKRADAEKAQQGDVNASNAE